MSTYGRPWSASLIRRATIPAGSSLLLDANLGITLSGSNVTTWADQSGSGNNFVQATGAIQPLINNSSINGQKGVTFSGSTGLSCTGTFATGAKTVVIVFKLTSNPTSGNFYSFLSLKEAGPLYVEALASNISVSYQPYTFGNDFLAITPASGIANALDTSAHALLFTYNGGTNTSTASYTAQLNGSAQSVVASSAINRGAGTDLCSLGCRLTSGNAASAGVVGDICWVGVWPRVLGVAEQSQLNSYLVSRYGV